MAGLTAAERDRVAPKTAGLALRARRALLGTALMMPFLCMVGESRPRGRGGKGGRDEDETKRTASWSASRRDSAGHSRNLAQLAIALWFRFAATDAKVFYTRRCAPLHAQVHLPRCSANVSLTPLPRFKSSIHLASTALPFSHNPTTFSTSPAGTTTTPSTSATTRSYGWIMMRGKSVSPDGAMVTGSWIVDGRVNGDCPRIECPRAKTCSTRFQAIEAWERSDNAYREASCSVFGEVSASAVEDDPLDLFRLRSRRHEAAPSRALDACSSARSASP